MVIWSIEKALFISHFNGRHLKFQDCQQKHTLRKKSLWYFSSLLMSLMKWSDVSISWFTFVAIGFTDECVVVFPRADPVRGTVSWEMACVVEFCSTPAEFTWSIAGWVGWVIWIEGGAWCSGTTDGDDIVSPTVIFQKWSPAVRYKYTSFQILWLSFL